METWAARSTELPLIVIVRVHLWPLCSSSLPICHDLWDASSSNFTTKASHMVDCIRFNFYTHACPHKHIIHTLTQKQQPPPVHTDLCTDFLVKPVRISRLLPTHEFSIFGAANPRLPLFVSVSLALSLPSLAGHPVLLTYANVHFVTHFTYVSFPSVCCSQWAN